MRAPDELLRLFHGMDLDQIRATAAELGIEVREITPHTAVVEANYVPTRLNVTHDGEGNVANLSFG